MAGDKKQKSGALWAVGALILAALLAYILYWLNRPRRGRVEVTDRAERGGINGANDPFRLVHWNVFRNLRQLDIFLREQPLTVGELTGNLEFGRLAARTFSADSYGAVISEGLTVVVHPERSFVGKSLAEIDPERRVLNLFRDAARESEAKREFYIGLDGLEKYAVFVPLLSPAADEQKLFYMYVTNTRSLPSFYLRALKESQPD